MKILYIGSPPKVTPHPGNQAIDGLGTAFAIRFCKELCLNFGRVITQCWKLPEAMLKAMLSQRRPYIGRINPDYK
jgi:hypothetical protein